MSEKKPEAVASTKTEVRERVLPDQHFEFRDGDAPDPVHARQEGQPVSRCREARLRPEYAQIYPCLIPGIWEMAAIIVDKVLAWQLQQRRGLVHRDRVLDPRHFDFRRSPLVVK